MFIFEIIYIPALVVVIIGGSAVSFAELIYSVIKFADQILPLRYLNSALDL